MCIHNCKWKMAILKTGGTERDWVACPGRPLQEDGVEHKKKKGMLFPAPLALFCSVIARPGMQTYFFKSLCTALSVPSSWGLLKLYVMPRYFEKFYLQAFIGYNVPSYICLNGYMLFSKWALHAGGYVAVEGHHRTVLWCTHIATESVKCFLFCINMCSYGSTCNQLMIS